MLDDMQVLRDAVQDYRTAAISLGLPWPEPGDVPGEPVPDVVHRIFDVDHIAEQLSWLQAQGWEERAPLPHGGWLFSWPTEANVDEMFGYLSLSFGAPFPWRHQLPLFWFHKLVYTFVLAGDHEGEIWRYEIEPDTDGPVRAATSLAALFTQWTRAIRAGLMRFDDPFIRVGEESWSLDALVRALQEAGLDPVAFPLHLFGAPVVRARQIEAGVDMDTVDRGFDAWEELDDEIDRVRATLRF
ncbi:hypothetical protein SRB5_10260 [Streptomyces sp. RB5]|uniref:Uncharacterized protein n=1 Tax=Streptomyces smaragdinus TaxID=2585196 RepID=A0A7K0CBY3_9ACTN|nr:hypothetical protein [Streptomyces smaragdinus]MQY10913.1 hypothetical protein [Streptomyces smaragdinus]